MYKCHLYLFTYIGFQHIMFVLLNSKTTSVTGGTGTANPSGAHEFTPIFIIVVGVAQPLVLCVVFVYHRSFFCPFTLAINCVQVKRSHCANPHSCSACPRLVDRDSLSMRLRYGQPDRRL